MVHRATTLAKLDELYLQYRDSDGEPRMDLIFEDEEAGTSYGNDKYRNEGQIILDLANIGNFDDALDLFKKRTKVMAKVCLVREANVIKRISNIEKEGNISHVFIQFGSNHSHLYGQLRQNGLEANRVFLDDSEDSTTHWFDPGGAAIRKCMYRGVESLSELEWYKSMIGDIVYDIGQRINIEMGDVMSEQAIAKMSIKVARNFKSVDDVELFRQCVVSEGLYAAFERFT